MVVITITW